MRRHTTGPCLVGLAACVLAAPPAHGQGPKPGPSLDLTNAAVVAPEGVTGPPKKAVEMLVREVEARTGLRWPVVSKLPEGGRPVVVVGTLEALRGLGDPVADALPKEVAKGRAEGYLVVVPEGHPAAGVIGTDARGVVFGVGRLLRELRYARAADGKGKVSLPDGFKAESAPKMPLRGQQLGYRPKTNSYDAWDLPQWDRYIGELAAFGNNAVELIPPRTDDDDNSPHFPRPKMEMLAGMSKICDDYGMDVWVWFPVMYGDISKPEQFEAGLKEWEEVYKAMPRLDAVFVPGGDPGHTPPKPLFAFMEKATELLHKYHPKGQMWVSPQGFNAKGSDEFMELVKAEPSWLTGLVFGPQVRIPLAELRKITPSKYPIRGYPDVTHSRQCQHPVQDWDLAYAVTEGRESINPRPRDEAAIFQSYRPLTNGFITYSEGCNDDVNKFVWSALGWDPEADLNEALRQYARYLVGDPEGDRFAQALFALERNWKGPLLTNSGAETTLRQLQDLERTAPPKVRQNWRFQQALYRGYYDAYLRDRLTAETAQEAEATDLLRQAPVLGSLAAVRRASAVLDRAVTQPVSPDRRARVFELAEALVQSIQMQLSTPKYLAINPERGANLDTIDTPLNNRLWLNAQLAAVVALTNERERLRAIDGLLHRADPGPGGFYDDLGDPANSPHLVREPGFENDPMLVRTPFQGFALRATWPTAWRQYTQTFYDAPLSVEYTGLDPSARYKVKVVYAGDNFGARMRLDADGAEVHPLTQKPTPPKPLEFDLPDGVTADGKVRLTWNREPGSGGNGRGNQVAEVWLIRKGN
jgi:hypothetical protein